MDIAALLGDDADSLLDHVSKGIPKEDLHLPGPDFVDRVWAGSDRPVPVLRNLQQLYGNGRLADTGHVSILPVDQGIEHSAAALFAPNPKYFDPQNIIELARRRRTATRSPPRSACSVLCRGSTRTRSRSSRSSITTSS